MEHRRRQHRQFCGHAIRFTISAASPMRFSEASPLISIRRAATELERLEKLLHAVVEACRHAIRSTADYAIEIEPAGASEFRQHLQALQRQTEAAALPQDWSAIQSSLRGELRNYREKA